MPKFIIKWNDGNGWNYKAVEAEDRDKAELEAYLAWYNGCDSNEWCNEFKPKQCYGVMDYTKERAKVTGVGS